MSAWQAVACIALLLAIAWFAGYDAGCTRTEREFREGDGK